jgi:orotidine-5'-phosphate decarboxylase
LTSAGGVASTPFGERLAERVAERRSNLVLGLDPDPARLWPSVAVDGRGGGDAAEAAARAAAAQCGALIDAAGGACVAAKLQLACFERLGAPGWAALERTAGVARDAGLLVIADGKRGDVPVRAAAYAPALLTGSDTPWGHVRGLAADAVTASPLLGGDALAPLVEAAATTGAGVFALVRTSNPGAADVQDVELAAGGALWERLAQLAHELGAHAVMGATAPGHLARARELMPRAVFLLPGVGAQGGRVEDLAPAFAPGAAGGLVTASRSIALAHESVGGDPGEAARAEALRLRDAAWTIATA